MRHSMFYLLVLAAAVGIPYFSTEWNKTGQWFSGKSVSAEASPGGDAAGGNNVAAIGGSAAVNGGPALPAPPGAANQPNIPPVVEIAEALRLDVNSAWVLGRWPRVTAGLPDEDLQGYRVALVTGTRE